MASVKQDMPPPGGFSRVVYERVPLKKVLPTSVKWILGIGLTAVGWYGFRLDKKRITYETIEKRSALFSILPALIAENDRVRLKIYRKVRDEEAELMKDVEGWQVGTYKGEPIYKSLKPNEWYDPSPIEMWTHADHNDLIFPYHVLQLR